MPTLSRHASASCARPCRDGETSEAVRTFPSSHVDRRDRKIPIDGFPLGDVTDQVTLFGVGPAIDLHLAAGQWSQSEHRLDQRALACAVGAYDADQLPLGRPDRCPTARACGDRPRSYREPRAAAPPMRLDAAGALRSAGDGSWSLASRLSQCPRDLIDVEANHADIGPRGTFRRSHRVGVELAADGELISGGRATFDQAADVLRGDAGLDEYRLHMSATQHSHQCVDRAEVGFVRSADSLQAMYFHVIGAAKIAKRIMRSYEDSLFGGNLCQAAARFIVQGPQLGRYMPRPDVRSRPRGGSTSANFLAANAAQSAHSPTSNQTCGSKLAGNSGA